MNRFRLGGVILTGAVSLCFANPGPGLSGSQAEPVQGVLMARSSEDGEWRTVKPGQVDQGSWLRTQAGCEAVVALRNDSHFRMAENTSVHVSSAGSADAKVEVLQGKVLSDVPEHGRSQVTIETPKGSVHSSGGVTLVEVVNKDSYVNSLSGSATVQGEQLSVPGLGAISDKKQARLIPGIEVQLSDPQTVALAGPDVRRRNKKRGQFVQGEETGPKRLGEDVTPSPSPSPAVTPPPPVQTTTVQPPPPPPNNPPVVTEGGGGGEAWPYLLGAAALGTGAYFLFRDDSSDDNNGFINNTIIPASP